MNASTIDKQQRREPVSTYLERSGLRQDPYSRPSSSSGQSTRSLRRTERVDDLRPSRLRSSSVDSPSRETTTASPERPPRSPARTAPSHRRASSAWYASQPPHPALRISRRTHDAIQYVIEEFLRNPNNFTPDLEEENAQMSDLGGGRASNGGARTGGPVPVGGSGTPTGGIRTPRDVMRDRTAREARRQEEQKQEEARRLAEERRRSAERRAEAVTGRGSRVSSAPQGYAQQPMGYDGAGDRRSGAGAVSGADVLGEPVSRTQEYPSGRARGPSISQAEYARAQQSAAGGARGTRQSQAQPRQPSQSSAAAGPSAQPLPQQPGGGDRGTTSSFPHAFERWENLSAHWEGLTSYWLHKLEQNTEEIRNNVPNASTLNRQITDLSAAGANLFHAVVELQRLRASSERKFQRWFFETRSADERSSENLAQAERQLKLERSAREEAAIKRAEAEQAADLARKDAAEARRELAISKEEAHRAWDELGHRNQEALELADNLKGGRMAVVGGVQVVPYFAGPSRSGTGASQRPGTREGQSQQYASNAGAAGLASPGDDDEAYYAQQRPSPTNTDPFTEQQQPPTSQVLQHEPDKASLAAGTYMPQQGGSSRMPQGTTASGMPISSQEAQRFYQQPPGQTFLHSPPGSSSGAAPAPSSSRQPTGTRREDVRSEASYADTMSEGDTEYAIDAGGNIQHDEQGRPIVFRRPPGRVRSQEEESEDPYDEEAIRHEQELATRHGGRQQGYGAGRAGDVLPEAPTVPSTAAQAMATYTPTTGGPSSSGASRPDYEGGGYGEGGSSGYGDGWEALQTRHHHPTRLSDVLEEDEERSSRRSRAGTGE